MRAVMLDGFVGLGLDTLGELVFMQDGRVRFHGIAHVDYVGQRFVVDLDECERLAGDGIGCGGDGGDRVAVIEHVFAGHHVPRHIAEIDHQFARCRVFDFHIGEIVLGDDGFDPGQRFGGRGVDRPDIGAGVGAAQHAADQLAGQGDIRRVAGAAGDFVDGIAACCRVCADDLEIFFLVRNFRREG